jgi:tight adherence protein B
MRRRSRYDGRTWPVAAHAPLISLSPIVLFLVAWLLGAPIYASLGFFAAGAFGLPRWIVNFLRRRRFEKFLNEFANAIDVVVRGVKAGLPLNDCVRIIAAEAAEPVKRIAPRPEARHSAGGSARCRPHRPGQLLRHHREQAEAGAPPRLANLSRVLRGHAVKRNRHDMGRSRHLHHRLAAGVLMVISFPSSLMAFTEPATILGASAVWMLIGVLVMRKMINFDF